MTFFNRKSENFLFLLFFRSYNEVFVQTAFIPYYLSTDINVVCVLCTSSSAAVVTVAYLSSPSQVNTSNRARLLWFGSDFQKINWRSQEVPHTISPFLYLPFYFFAATTKKCLYKQHLLPTSLLASIILRCDHGPDSLHAVICTDRHV